MYGGSLPIAERCAKALKGLGHLVEYFPSPQFYSAFQAVKECRVSSEGRDYLENSFLQVVSQAVVSTADEFKPDLVLCLAQAPLSRRALKKLRGDGVPTAMWFVEDYTLFTYWRAFAPLYDFFFVIQGEDCLNAIYDIGVDNVEYLPLAADPDFHTPLELSPAERKIFGSDVSFLGAGYPNRRRAFHELTGYDFKLWGTEWDGDPILAPHLQRGGARIEPEEVVKIFNASKINLNLHSSVQAEELVPAGDFVNPRTFELAACGAFQLVDKRELMPELFKTDAGLDDELVTFTSMAELKEKIDYYLCRPEEREAAAAKARERVLKDHTYAARMQSIIDFVASRLSDWPKPRTAEPTRFAEWPDAEREQMQSLLEDLGLPEDVDFDDLVWSLRQRQGVLSPLETTILFLDEWRKQYGG
jgi:spore maturation protein CgeB